MSETITIRRAETPADIDAVRQLCWEYRAYLIGFSDAVRALIEQLYPLGDYSTLMDDLPRRHARPRGVMLIAERDGDVIGCGMYHGLTPGDAEIKRVYIVPRGRGTGAGEALSTALVEQARADRYDRVLLDTNVGFDAARRLYEKLGFVQRGPYTSMPQNIADALVFYELTLPTG